MHSHTYHEVVHVIQGSGVGHFEDGTDAPIDERKSHPPTVARTPFAREHGRGADARPRRLPPLMRSRLACEDRKRMTSFCVSPPTSLGSSDLPGKES